MKSYQVFKIPNDGYSVHQITFINKELAELYTNEANKNNKDININYVINELSIYSELPKDLKIKITIEFVVKLNNMTPEDFQMWRTRFVNYVDKSLNKFDGLEKVIPQIDFKP